MKLFAPLVVLALAPAVAGETGGLDRGALSVYAGVGVDTFRLGASGVPRDRQLRTSLDLYGAVGLGRGFQLAVDAPVVAVRVLDDPAQGPCPGADAWCGPVTTVGEAGLTGRLRGAAGPWSGAAELSLRTDAWNAPTRGWWTNAGQGTSRVAAQVAGARGFGERVPIEVGARVGYGLVFGRLVTLDGDEVRVPADTLGGAVMGEVRPGPWSVGLGASGWTRLWGLPWGPEWQQQLAGSEDLWAALRYREVRAEVRAGRSLGRGVGIYARGSRVLWADSGPADDTQVGVGVGWYRAARAR